MTRDDRIRQLRSQGLSYAKIGKELGVHESTAYRVINETWELKPLDANKARTIFSEVTGNNPATMYDIARRHNTTVGMVSQIKHGDKWLEDSGYAESDYLFS